MKWRLSLLLTGLFLVSFLFETGENIFAAKQDIGRESRAAVHLVQALLESAPHLNGLPMIPIEAVEQLSHVRHLRVTAPDGTVEASYRYPGWFANLFDVEPQQQKSVILIARQGNAVGIANLIVVPDDELEEIWSDTRASTFFALLQLVLLNTGAWIIVSTQLKPLQQLRLALESIGHGVHGVQIQPGAVSELAAVEQGFNRMATALSDADDNNRRLMRELLRVQEEERRAIARELHDEFAQQATAIDAEAVVLSTVLPNGSPSQASISSIRQSARTLMRMVRNRLQQLRPELLDEFGVVAALDDLCAHFQNTYPALDLEIERPNELNVGDELAIALFRLVQEALTNIARHASAARIRIEIALRADGDELSMQVLDDGIGIAPGRREGFGVPGMRERVESLGGFFELGPGLDQRGLSVTAIIPITSGTVS